MVKTPLPYHQSIKSLTTSLPPTANHQIKIGKQIIPQAKNQRFLGCYLNDNTLLTDELHIRKSTISQTLTLIPTNIIQPRNLNKIINAKCLSLVTHLARGNAISSSMLEKIDARIRYKMRAKLDVTSTAHREYMYLPLKHGGLNIPSIEHQTNKITINTLLKYYYSDDPLMSDALYTCLTKAQKSKKSQAFDIFEKFWDILFQNDITAEFIDSNHVLSEKNSMKHHNKCSKFEIWTDGSRTKDGTGFGIIISSKIATTKHIFNLEHHHSHNIAEILAILTTIKLLPRKAKAKIYTDSLICKNLLENPHYFGPFKAIQDEYLFIIGNKSLDIELIKVEGHVNIGNIQVDKLAKKACTSDKTISIEQLLTNKQILFYYNGNETLDPISILNTINLENNLTSIKDQDKKFKFNIPETYQFFHSKKISPTQKYSIWRNIHKIHQTDINNNHPTCPICKCTATMKHLTTECPHLDFIRTWAINEIKSFEPSKTPTFKFYTKSSIDEIPIRYNSSLTKKSTEELINNPKLMSKIIDIQSIIAVLNGKAYCRYMELKHNDGTTGTQ